MAGFVLVPFGLFGRTAFLAEKVLGNVVSSGVKILVLAVIVGIGSTIFGQFTSVLNNPPTITDALTLILAALSMLGLTIFGPGIANGLIAGGPQLGAGAAVGTGMAVAGVGFAGASLAAGGIGAAGSAIAGGARAGASVVGGRSDGVSRRRRRPQASRPTRRPPPARFGPVGPAGSEAPATGGQAAAGQASAPGSNAPSEPESSGPPAWVRRMKRDQAISRGVSAVEHALRSGDHPSSGGGVDLSEGD